jgi:2-alkyl-3-oxoalkanoate reductase
MRIFIAGATGTLGRPVVRALVARGHDVVGLTRTEAGARRIESMGAQAVVGDALDADRLRSVVVDARPEQVVHLLTALPPAGVLRKGQLEPTNQLRITGTANLLTAAAAAGARRLVAESFIGVYGPGEFERPATEDDALAPIGRGAFADAILALRSLEEQLGMARATRAIETVALRFGLLYGSEVPSTQAMIAQARAGRLFIPRGMSGVASFVHNDDAAGAVVAAIEHRAPSLVYNVADDEPMMLRDFMARLAAAVSAPPPRTIPSWIVRLLAPVIAEMGAAKLPLSNARAKRELGWAPRYPSVRMGLAELQREVVRAA